jgi:low temperature requirement protein LtrA
MSLLRKRGAHEARVTPVELFFDLVFVFAVTQLSHYLLAHLDPMGALQTLVMFIGVWWLWIYTSWVTNWLDPDRKRVRLMIFALMAAAMILAMSIEEAWGERGLIFAAAYVFTHVGRSLFMVASLRGERRGYFRNFSRITLWLVASGIFWIGGGFAEGDLRLWLWITAIAIETAGPPLYYWVPFLGLSSTSDWDVTGSHMAERCGLFVIIALGESIIITGATAAKLAWSASTLLAFAAAFFSTVAMWWLYFNIGAVRAEEAINQSDDPGRYARLVYTYIHLPIIAGIIVSAAADELVLAHPYHVLKPIEQALVIGGPALFLAGNSLFKRTSWRWFPLSHHVALALLALLAFFAGRLEALTVALVTCAILVATAVWETISLAPGERSLDRRVRELLGK